LRPSTGINAGDLAARIVSLADACVLHRVLHLRDDPVQIANKLKKCVSKADEFFALVRIQIKVNME